MSNDYMELKRNYRNMMEFKDKDKQSGEFQDLIDRLEGANVKYAIYHNSTDNGCTVFYNDIKTSTDPSIMCSTFIVNVGDIDQYQVDAEDEDSAIQFVLDNYCTDADIEEYNDDPGYVWAFEADDDDIEGGCNSTRSEINASQNTQLTYLSRACSNVADRLEECLGKLSEFPNIYDYIEQNELDTLSEAYDILLNTAMYLRN